MRAPRPTRGRRTGAAAAELAITLPLLVLLLLGIWEVGRLVHVKQIVSNAAREGARAASTGSRDYGAVEATVRNYLVNAGLNVDGVTVAVENRTAPGGSADDPRTAEQLDELEVRVRLPFDNVRWVMIDQITNVRAVVAAARWRSMKDLPIAVSLSGNDIPQVPLQ